jgi:WD40 repeat protein
MQLDKDNPWPGLASFEEDSHAFFFGRDHEIKLLRDHVLDGQVTVLYGRSGLGKTSLLQAGLFPTLRERHLLPIYIRFDLKPGAAPLTQQLHHAVRDSIRADVPDPMLPSDEESLWEYLHRMNFELWSARNYPLTPVIVLDQFEELFTLGERVPELVDTFRNELGDLVENRIPAELATRIDNDEAVARRFNLRSHNYKLLISLREDFLPDLEAWCRLIPSLARSRVRLLHLRVNEAFDAVHEPAADMMSPELARRVVGIIAGENLAQGRAPAAPELVFSDGQQTAAEVEPALLSLFCRELNEERKRRGLARFDEQLIDEASHDTLSNYYESCVRDLPDHVAEFIESELITEKGFRNSFIREDAVPARLTEEELDQLISSRLVRLEDRYGAPRIELTHDVLTRAVREHRDRRRAEEGVAAQMEEERQAAAQREAKLEAEKQQQQAELDRAELRAAQDRERAARESQETAEAHAATLRKQSRILRAVLAAALIVAFVAVGGFTLAIKARQSAYANLRAATVQELIAQAQGMLANTIPGGDQRAFQKILAARALSRDNTTDGALYTAVVQRASTLKIIPADIGAVTSVAFSPNGQRLASAGAQNTVRLSNAETGQPIGSPLTGHTGAVTGVAFSPDGHRLASSSYDSTVRLWDADTGQPIGAPLTGRAGAVLGIAFSPDGQRLASADADNTVRLWSVDTGQPIGAPLTGHTDAVTGVAFSPDGHRLASSSADKTVRLWSVDTGQPIGAPLTGHTDAVLSVAFSPDGHRLASSSNDQTVRLWDADTGQPTGAPLTGHTGAVTRVAFSPDGRRLASASADNTVRLWETNTGQPIGDPLTGHTRAVYGVAFSPDGLRLASASYDETVRLWDAHVIESAQLTGDLGAVTALAFSPDGYRLASGSDDMTVRLWDAATGQSIGAPLIGHSAAVFGVAFSPDGRRLASASDDTTVRLWDTDTGQPIGAPLAGHSGAVFGVAFSPDGDRLASADADGTVRLWDANTGRTIGAPLTGHTGAVLGVAFSPDGRRLASASDDRTVRLWNVETGQPIGAPLAGHTGAVKGVAFSPDGHRLASAGADATVRLWDTGTGQQIGPPLTGHTRSVTGVAFSPNGNRLASGSDDKTVRLWDAATGQQIGDPLSGHTGAVKGVAFSPDGNRLASANEDKTVRQWQADASPQILCDKLTVNMSAQQWREWVSTTIPYIKLCPELPIAADAKS